jgi:hypothetical protein
LLRTLFLQVALKRQQAAEDAIALGLTAVATGTQYGYLPPGPIFGMAITAPKSQDQGKSFYFTTQERILYLSSNNTSIAA